MRTFGNCVIKRNGLNAVDFSSQLWVWNVAICMNTTDHRLQNTSWHHEPKGATHQIEPKLAEYNVVHVVWYSPTWNFTNANSARKNTNIEMLQTCTLRALSMTWLQKWFQHASEMISKLFSHDSKHNFGNYFKHDFKRDVNNEFEMFSTIIYKLISRLFLKWFKNCVSHMVSKPNSKWIEKWFSKLEQSRRL